MKRLIMILALAGGVLAACSPAATPSPQVVTPPPTLPAASSTPSAIGSGAGSSLSPLSSPSRTP